MQHSITTNAVSRPMWRVVCAFMVALLAGLMLTQKPAEAASIRVACDVYATNQVDPIVIGSGHLHNQVGNLSTNDSSTFESLYASKATSCDGKWWTNAGWFPVERYEPVSSMDVYYRGPGDQTQVHNIPNGLQLIARQVQYNCGASPLNAQNFQSTPPYSCTDNWATRLTFPACWNGWGLNPEATVYGPNRMSCPASYPIRLPEINYLINHRNTDGKVPNPLTVSAGVDQWEPYDHMHADYFFAAQDEFQHDVDLDGDGRIEHTDGGYTEKALLDLCVREAPQELAYNNARCRTSGLLPAHVRAINNHY